MCIYQFLIKGHLSQLYIVSAFSEGPKNIFSGLHLNKYGKHIFFFFNFRSIYGLKKISRLQKIESMLFYILCYYYYYGFCSCDLRFQPKMRGQLEHFPSAGATEHLPEASCSATASDHVEQQRDLHHHFPERKIRGKSRAAVDMSRHQPYQHHSSNAARRREYVTDDGAKRKGRL